MEIGQTRVGNVFSAGEPLRFVLSAFARKPDKIAWSVTDHHGDCVMRGEQAVTDVPVRLTLPGRRVGYFEVEIAACGAEKTFETARTSFAVVSDVDFSAVRDSPFGVCTHFGQWWDTEIIPLIARAGIKEIRDEQYWESLEKEKGVFSFPKKCDAYMAALAAANLTPHIGLTYGNRLYHRGRAPYEEKGFLAFARYAVELLARYAGQIRSVEVWNEWNSPGFSSGPAAARPEVYAGLLERTFERIKQKHPEVKVIGGSVTGLWWGGYFWLRRLLKIPGAIDRMDALSVHPYKCELEPEYLPESMARLRRMMRDAGGPVRPLWVTELGWPINVHPQAVADQVYESLDVRTSEEVQAHYLVRSYVLLLAAGVEKIHWYDFMNDGTDSRNGEHNFGLIRHPDDAMGRYAPLPAYSAYAEMTRRLTGAEFVRQEQTPPTMRSFVFRGKGGETRVAWSLEPTVLRVRAAKPFTVADLMGQTRTVEPADGLAVLPVRRGEPVYLVGDVDQVDAGLTVRVDRKCSACVGEMALVPYRIENAFPFPVSVGLEGGGARQQATVKPDSVEQGRVALPPDTAPGKKVLAFHVRTGGELLAEMPVEIRADNRLAFPQPPHMADDATMRLMLRNASREQSLSIDRILWTAGLAEGVREVSLSIAPGEEVSLAIPEVRLEPYAVVPLCVEGRLGGEFLGGWQGIIGDNPVHRLTPTMDGNLDEWEDLPAIDLRKHGTVKMTQDGGPADLSGKLWLAHDERNFYLAARITDDAHHPPVEENDIGDQIEFVVSPMPPWQAAARYWPGEGFYRFAVSLRASGPQVYQMKGVSEDEGQSLAEGAVCRARREGMETIYEVSIPREGRELFTPGCPYFSLSLLVRDRDGPDRGGWIEWGSGFAKGKRRERFHLCRLGKR